MSMGPMFVFVIVYANRFHGSPANTALLPIATDRFRILLIAMLALALSWVFGWLLLFSFAAAWRNKDVYIFLSFFQKSYPNNLALTNYRHMEMGGGERGH